MPNVFSHPYQLDESISNFKAVGIFHFFNRALCTQLVENLIRNRVAASDLVLLRLPMAQAYMG